MLGSLPNLAPFGGAGLVISNPYTTGLLMDMDASRCGVTADGTALATWPDQSGNGNDLTQATSANRPLYKIAQVAGRPAILFDGSNDKMANTAYAGIGTGDFTAFFVVKSTLLSSDAVCWSMGTNTTNLGMMLGIGGSDNDGTWNFSKPGSLVFNTSSPGAAAAWAVTRVQRSTTTGAIYVNGQPATGGSGSLGTLNVGAGFRLGCDTANVEPWKGYIARHLFYSGSLTDPQAHAIEDYLGLISGVTITH